MAAKVPFRLVLLKSTCAAILLLYTSLLAAQTTTVFVEPYRTWVSQSVQVPAGQYLYYELQLNRANSLVARFNVEGGLNNQANVWLLDASNFAQFKAGRTFSVYQGTSGTVQGIADYRFPIPQTDNYVLVVDNRKALLMARKVHLYIYELYQQPTEESLRQQRALQSVYDSLKKLLVFKDFRIISRHCGTVNAFSNPDITMCAELAESLADKKLVDALPFVMFHELGHTLLRLWDYPLYDNEDVADEFATVISLLANKTDFALAAARWWSTDPSEREALSKLWVDDRHTVSPQRARNIIRWINDPDELLRRWHKILVPNMQSDALRALDEQRNTWINHELIKAELKRRTTM